ncbi:sialate O-acetylesterase [candidate division KSB1 bacterium]|nr:sialate O-acetylesterase [candidate division KSB1 bacterium]
MIKFRTLVWLAPLFVLSSCSKPVPPRLFLLVGQSNMAGRGEIAAEDTLVHPRVWSVNREGEWVPAQDPLHFDKPIAGAGLGRSFAIAVAETNPDPHVVLIPCAAGGSPISAWRPGAYWEQTDSHPYDDAVRRARAAMQRGRLAAILWHQGEGDSKPGLSGDYQANLLELIARFRRDLDAPRVPFIIGQLGQFAGRPWDEHRAQVERAQRQVAAQDPLVGFVSSDGLTCMSDSVHFDSPSLRELGRRYAEVYLRMRKDLESGVCLSEREE